MKFSCGHAAITTTIILATGALSASAQTVYIYTGPDTTSGNIWSNVSNWSPTPPAGGPSTLDTATIGSVAANQTLTYDSAASGTLATLSIAESTAGVTNELDLSGNSLAVTNAINLSASSGTSEIALETGKTLNAIAGLTLGSGGNVTFVGNGTLAGPINLAGGEIDLNDSSATFTGDVSSTGGTISSDIFNSNVTLTLEGATNNLTNLSGSSALENVTLQSEGVNQSFNSNIAIDGLLTVQTAPVSQIDTVSDAAGIGAVDLSATNNFTNAVLKAGADLTVGTIQATSALTGVNGFVVDAGGHVLTDTEGVNSFNTGVFEATTTTIYTGSGGTPSWLLDDSSNNGGVFAAPSFDLSETATGSGFTNGGVSVGHDLTLDATTAGAANNLSNTVGLISANSTFLYTGPDNGSSMGTLTSNRAIGNLAVGDGTNASYLQLASSFSVKGGIIVQANSILDVDGLNLTEAHATGGTSGGLSGGGTVLNSSFGTPSILTLDTTGGNGIFSGVIENSDPSAGGGTMALTKIGSGTQILSGANTYSGTTTINGGTLDLGGGTAGGSINPASTLLLSGGTLRYTVTGGATQSFAGTTIAGASSIGAVAGDTLALGAITRTVGGTIDFSSTGSVTTTTTHNSNGILGGYATVGGATWAVAPTTSGGAITGLTNYTTTTTTGTLAANYVNQNIDVTSTGTTSAGITPNSLRFNTPAVETLTLGNTSMVGSGGLLVTGAVGANTSTIAGSTIEGSFGGDLVVIQNDISAPLIISSSIGNNSAATGVTKSGAGTLFLTGSSTYDGPTTIDAGILNAAALNGTNNSSLGHTSTFNGVGSMVVLNGGTLQFTGAATSGTLVHSYTLTTNGGAFDSSGTGMMTISGSMTVSGTSGSQTLTLTGTSSGAGMGNVSSVIKNGTGTNVTALTKSGSGTWALTAADTYTGATTITGGTLILGNGTGAGSINAGSNLILGGGALSDSRTGASTQTFNGTTLASGASAVATSVTTENVALGAISRSLGGTIDFTTTGTISTITPNTGATILGGWATVNGTTWAVGGGPITGLASYTTSNAGTTTPGTTADVDFTASNTTAWNSQTINSLRFNTAAATTLTLGVGQTLVDATGGILETTAVGANATTITGGMLEGAANADLVVIQNNTGAGLTIASTIADNTSATGLTKSGAGLLTLSGTNTYTGMTTINAGTLTIGATGSLADSTNLSVANTGTFTVANGGSILGTTAVTDNGAVTFSDTAQMLGSLNGTGSLTLDGDTLTVSNGGAFSGVILNGTGVGGLTVTGGTLLLSGVNTYTGVTMVNGGILRAGISGSSGGAFGLNSAVTIGAGGLLDITGFSTQIGSLTGAGSVTLGSSTLTTGGDNTSPAAYAGVISGTGVFAKIGTGAETLSGANTYSGGTLVSGGTLMLNGVGTLGATSGTLTVNTGGTLDVGGTSQTVGNLTGTGGTITDSGANATLTIGNGNATGGNYAGVIANGTGTLSLTKTGTGTLILSGGDTFTGATLINVGVLNYQNATAFGTNSAITVASGGTAQVQGGITGGSQTMTLSGTGAAGTTGALDNLSGNNTYAGAINLAANSTISSDAGILTLSGATITDGSNTLTLAGAGTGTVSGAVGSGTGGLTKLGLGTWTLAGTNTYTGVTAVNAGTLAVSGSINPASTLALGGGTFSLIKAGTNTQAFNGTTINPGASAINTTVATDTIALGALTHNTGGTVDFGSTGKITTTSTTLTNGILGGYATVAGTGWATVAPTGTITALGTYTTTTTAGTVSASYANANIDVTSTVAPTGTITPNTLRFNTAAGETLTLTGVNILQSGGILETTVVAGNGSIVTGGTLESASGELDVIQNDTTAGGTLYIGSAIADNGSASSLTKSGAGALVLDGANTYTGTTTINAGVLQVGDSLGNGSIASNRGSIVDNASLVFNSYYQTYGGNISGTGSVTKSGLGSLGLIGNETYTGSTVVSGGTLTIGGSVSSSSGLVLGGGSLQFLPFSPTATLIFASTAINSGSSSVANLSNGTIALGPLTRSIGGTVDFSPISGTITTTSTNTGNTILGGWATVNGSTYATVGTNGVISGLATYTPSTSTSTLFGSTADVDFQASNTTLLAGQTINSLRFNTPATTAFTLSGNQTLTIQTGGILETGSVGANQSYILGSNSTILSLIGGDVVINQNNSAGALVINSMFSNGANGLTKAGVGTVYLTAPASTYTGATTIDGGILNVAVLAATNVNSTIGTGTANLVLNGGTLQYTGSVLTSTNRGISLGSDGGGLDASGINAGTVSFTGNITTTGTTGSQTLTLTGFGTGNAGGGSFTSGILATSGSSVTSVLKTGVGTWSLTNTGSAYTGATTISGGILNVASLANINTSSPIGKGSSVGSAADLVLDGGTLQYTGSAGTSTNRGYTVTYNGGTFDASGTGALTLSGSMVASSTVGSQALVLTGTGTGVISGTLNNGTGSDVTGLTKTGLGTWTLTNTGSDTYTGATTINAGILNLGGASASGSINTTSTLVLGGGTLSYTRTGAATQTFNGLTVNPGSSAIIAVAGDTVALGAITRTAGGTVDFSAIGTTTTTNGNTNGILGGYATVGGTTWAVAPAVSGGAITGLANGSYNSSIAGTTAPGAAANVDFQASNTSAWSSQTVNSLRFNTAAATTLTLGSGQTLTDTTGGILETGTVSSSNSAIVGGTLEGSAGGDLIVLQNNATGTLSIASIIADDSSATGLTKSGVGALKLTGADTYTGATQVNGGSLIVTGGGSLSSTAATTVNTGATFTVNSGSTIGTTALVDNGTVNFSNTADSLTSLNGTSITANLNLLGTSTALTISNGGTFAGNIIGTGGSLTLNGGTLTLSGANNYGGPTIINGGTLKAGLTPTAGITTPFGFNSAVTLANTAGVTLDITYSNTSIGSLTGGGANGGNVILGAATLTLGSDNTSPAAFGGVISGIGGLTKIGMGTETLTGSNTYSGATTLSGGTLNLGGGTASGSLFNDTTLNLGGGTLSETATGGASQSFLSLAINPGASAITAVAGDTINLGNITRAVGLGGTVDLSTTGTFTTTLGNTNGILASYVTVGGATWAVAPAAAGGVITGLTAYTIGTATTTTTGSTVNLDLQASNTTAWATQSTNSLRFNTANNTTLTLSGTLSLVSGGILVTANTGTSTETITGGTLSGASNRDLVLEENDPSGGLIINSTLVNTNTTSLTKSGVGKVTITGTSTFTGAVGINAGTLSVTNLAAVGMAQALGQSAIAITLDGSTPTAAATLQYSGTTAATLAQSINISAGDTGTISNVSGQTLTVSGTLIKANSSLTFSGGVFDVTGQITGGTTTSFNSDMTVNSGATVTLDNANDNYTGPTYVYGAGTLRDGTGTAPSGTVLTLGNSSDGTVTNTFDINGKNQTLGALDSTGNGGGTNVNIVTNGAASGTSTVTISGFNSDSGGVNSTFGGVIQDGATAHTAVAISGGTDTFSGANTYTGATTISGGTLYANNTTGSGTGPGAVTVSNGGALGGSGTLAPVTTTGTNAITVATGGLLMPGGIQPTVPFTGTPGTAANGNLSLNPTGVTGTSQLLAMAPSTNSATPSLTFAIGSAGASEIIVPTSGVANVMNFNVGGSAGTSTVISINDLIGSGLTVNQLYVLIQGNTTTYEDNGAALSVGAGTLDSSGQILGGLSLLAPNTSNNYFRQLGAAQLFLVGDNIDVEVVPEPGTWAMLLGGVALLGFWYRRRREPVRVDT